MSDEPRQFLVGYVASQECEAIVEAESPEEARAKFLAGEVVEDWDNGAPTIQHIHNIVEHDD